MESYPTNKKPITLVIIIAIILSAIFVPILIFKKPQKTTPPQENTAKSEEIDPILKITPINKRKHGYIITAKRPVNSDKIVILIRLISQVPAERTAIKNLALEYLTKQQIDLKNYEIIYE